jgi:hypothetical protein
MDDRRGTCHNLIHCQFDSCTMRFPFLDQRYVTQYNDHNETIIIIEGFKYAALFYHEIEKAQIDDKEEFILEVIKERFKRF